MKVMFISLGCDKNLVDTEEMLGLLGDSGYTFTNDENEADVIIINTCCFINDAKEESINTILEMAEYKKSGKCKALIAAGCLATRYKDEILEEIPELDAIVGTTSPDRIAEAVKNSLEGSEDRVLMDSIDRLAVVKADRILTTGGWYEYLKISEGCDKNCTYCIIPKVRGRYRSYPIEYLLARAFDLAKNGCRELILVAQEVTLYGTDMPGKKRLLPNLLKGLASIKGIERIRLMYCYPEEITDELIELMKNEPKVCHYIDMPIQHASDQILKTMGRRTDRKSLEKVIKKLRSAIPDICIRTTLITGFPGETESDFKILKEFVRFHEFDRLGVFTYSEEEGTVAARLPRKISEEIKEERRDEIMEMQQQISLKKSSSFVGKSLVCIIDGFLPDEGVYVARSYRDAPDVDGCVFASSVNQGDSLISGTFVKIKITDATEYDLIGEIAEVLH